MSCWKFLIHMIVLANSRTQDDATSLTKPLTMPTGGSSKLRRDRRNPKNSLTQTSKYYTSTLSQTLISVEAEYHSSLPVGWRQITCSHRSPFQEGTGSRTVPVQTQQAWRAVFLWVNVGFNGMFTVFQDANKVESWTFQERLSAFEGIHYAVVTSALDTLRQWIKV